jgi:hypothetical protein
VSKSRYGEEVEEYQRLKSNATRRVYDSAFGHFLSFYQNKHGEGKGFSDYLDSIFEELKKPRRQQRRTAEIELVDFINHLREQGKSNNTIRAYFGAMQNFLKFKQITVSAIFIGNLPPATEKPINHKHEWTIEQNKSLISLLYLSARRISEIVGRKYKGFIYEGVKLKDFREDTLESRDVLIMNCLILKKWHRKTDEPKIIRKDVIMDMGDAPFIEHILTWREHQQEAAKEKFMPITRSRAYQILQQIDQRIVGPHWFRHMRLSHLAETLSPYQLNERIGFWESIDPAVAYVHGRVSDYLEACEKARVR